MSILASPFAPFRNRGFRIYWLAGLSANFGWQIQLVGASWLMLSMGGTASQVALVQTTVALPVMLMSLPGGALADRVGQRTLVIWAQSFLMIVSILLAAAAGFEILTPELLLACTFLIGSGRALYYPGWQSMVLEFFPRAESATAMTVNSSNLNIARSFGPALGGAIVASAGAFLAFLANAVANLSVIFVALGWPKPKSSNGLPPEPFGSAIIAGLRYMLLSPRLMAITVRSFVFNVAAIASIALMPLVARDLLGGGPQAYGVLLGAFGIGGVIGALSADAVRRRLSLEPFLAVGHLIFALATAALALSGSILISAPAALLAGIGWIFVQVTFNSLIQTSSPRWVLGRLIAIYQTFVFGGNALGSLVWGYGADAYGMALALSVPAAMTALGWVLGLVFRIHDINESLLDPQSEWVAPTPCIDMVSSSGPIVITVTYRIPEADIPQFLAAMRDKRRERIRDGAGRWTLSRDLLDPELWFERCKMATWAEAQRMQARRTVAGSRTIGTIRKLHQGPGRPEAHYELVRDPGRQAETKPVGMPEQYG